jgi:putative copper resistance protein D
VDAALGITVRWALVADLMLLFGVPLFACLSDASVGAKTIAPFRYVILTAALSGILLSALGLAILAATMSGVPLVQVDSATLSMLVMQTTVGTAFLVRVSALVAAFAFGVVSRGRRVVLLAVALCGAVALGSLAWSGHGVMDDGRTGTVHLVADIVHLLAAGVWVGALAALLWMLATAQDDSTAAAHHALAGFASVGTASVALIVASGLINSWLLVGPQNLLSLGTSLYGQLLLMKLALFAGMVSLAAINRIRLTPALGNARASGDTRQALRRLRLSLTLETFVAFAILGLVAWLGTLEPPVSAL